MSSPISAPIRYLAGCYEADQRGTGIVNLLHKDVEHRHFVSGTEVLLTGLQDAVAVPTAKGLEALKAATTYRREKRLVYGALLLVGKSVQDSGKATSFCAPLLHYPATIRRDVVAGEDVTFLRVEPEPNVNLSVFADILDEDELAIEAVQDLLSRWRHEPFDDQALSELIHILRQSCPDVAVDALYDFPKLYSERKVRELARSQGRLACVPAAVVALVPNPRGSRGLLFELSKLAQSEPSRPLRALLDEDDSGVAPSPSRSDAMDYVPALLSAAQQKALRSARHNTLSVIVGPPGTGKSYTVTALALEHVIRGESVLIACRTEQALDVIESKLRMMLDRDTVVIRGGATDFRRELKSFLTRLLSGQFESDGQPPGRWERKVRSIKRKIARTEDELAERHRLESAWGALVHPSDHLGIWGRMRLRWLRWRLERARSSWALMEILERLDSERAEAATAFLHAKRHALIANLLKRHRRTLKSFLGAIRARTSARQDRLFGEVDMNVLLETFPIWISTFRDLHRLVPLERELFDLVIVDEATQSDMASALPALQRASRVVITGDPRQLRHVSFLARKRQEQLAESLGLDSRAMHRLDYRDKSLLDLVDDRLSSNDQVAFLDEHYRSMPQIIQFSNREFYGNGLHVMTARPGTVQKRAVELHVVQGVRRPSGVNESEARALIDTVLDIVAQESELGRAICHSIGVLSPFRDQVDYLAASIHEKLSLDAVEKHDVLVGTAYGFQGEERDIMLLSLAVDPASHPSAFRHLNRPDVFNVALTRARDRQIVFTSLAPDDGAEASLAMRYLLEIARGSPRSSEANATDDEFLEEVSRRLLARGDRVWPDYAVAGMTVDLVVERHERTCGVDLIGAPGRFAEAIDLERYRMFRRAGLSIFPLPWSDWRRDEERCLEALDRHLV
jgi:hypothetical protein